MDEVKVNEIIQEKVNKLKSIVKFYASNRGYSLTTLLQKHNEVYGKNPDVSNFSAKFRRGTLTISELYELMDLLEIDITFQDRFDKINN